jgi:hypothetical protein
MVHDENQILIHFSHEYASGVTYGDYHSHVGVPGWWPGTEWTGFEYEGYLPDLGGDLDPRNFPGWFAHSCLLAIHFVTSQRSSLGSQECCRSWLL